MFFNLTWCTKTMPVKFQEIKILSVSTHLAVLRAWKSFFWSFLSWRTDALAGFFICQSHLSNTHIMYTHLSLCVRFYSHAPLWRCTAAKARRVSSQALGALMGNRTGFYSAEIPLRGNIHHYHWREDKESKR